MAAGDPYLVLPDIGRMLVALFPDRSGAKLLPVFAVPRIPHVAPVLRGVVRPSAEYPDAVAINHRREPKPLVPGSLFRHTFPVRAVGRVPDIVECLVFRHVVS